jgi:hypothetical protein
VKVGTLKVAGISGLDLAAPAAQLAQATTAIQGAVNNVLASINAKLANLVKVDVLKIDESVVPSNGYTTATAAVTAVRATLTPPTLPLSASTLIDLSGTPVSAVLQSLSSSVPTLTPLMGQLEATLGGIQALSAPTTISIGTLASTATFKPVTGVTPALPGSPTSPDLPRTGGNAALPAMLAVALGGIAAAMRRVVRSARVDA